MRSTAHEGRNRSRMLQRRRAGTGDRSMVARWADGVALIMDMTDAFDQYDADLNGDEDIYVGRISFERSRIMRELDPIAYRTGFSEWCDVMNIDQDSLEGADWRDDV